MDRIDVISENFSVIGDSFIWINGVMASRDDEGIWGSNCPDRTSGPTKDRFALVVNLPGTVAVVSGQVYLVPYDLVILFSQGGLTVADCKDAYWVWDVENDVDVLYIPDVIINGQIVVLVITKNFQDTPSVQ